MNLPKFSYPTITINIPSTKKDSSFRPFLVKEEKILLLAKSAENPTDILGAIKQVINNCSIDPGFNINKLTTFDIEYLFIKLHAASVTNVIKVSYKDNEDQKIYDFEINLDNVKMIYPEGINADNKIEISDKTGLILKYPSATIYDDKRFLSLENQDTQMFELVAKCIDQIYDGDKIYSTKDSSAKEINEFVEGLSMEIFEKIDNFLKNAPKMEYVLTYKNSAGTDQKIVLSTLNDFFTLR